MRIFTMEMTVNEIKYNKVKYLLQLLFVASWHLEYVLHSFFSASGILHEIWTTWFRKYLRNSKKMVLIFHTNYQYAQFIWVCNQNLNFINVDTHGSTIKLLCDTISSQKRHSSQKWDAIFSVGYSLLECRGSNLQT